MEFALKNQIDMVVVAPDDPLSLGMVDALEAAGIRAFGPVAAAARIESSKVFSKTLMKNTGFLRQITRSSPTALRQSHIWNGRSRNIPP